MTGLLEIPIDSRLHPALGSLLERVFRYEAVEAGRAKTYGDRFDAILREELEAQKQL